MSKNTFLRNGFVFYFLILSLVITCRADYGDNIHFKLFTGNHKSVPEVITITKENNNLLQTSFKVAKPTKVIVHGYKSSSDFFALVRIKDNYLSQSDYNVIMVDWSSLADGEYVATIANSRIVAAYVARLFLIMMKNGVQNIHAIGFSLGAHIPAVAASYLGDNKINRITGLDPAKPFLMSVGLDAKLDSSDAEFVDVYHTEDFLQGKTEQCGHVDFKMNWGQIQPGCGDLNLGCAHERAPIYFAESINSLAGFWGYPAYLHRDIWSGKVQRDSVMKLAGEYVDRSIRGFYFVPTNAESPFAKGYNF